MIEKKGLSVTELTKVLKNCLNLQFPGISVIGVVSDVYRAEGYNVFSLNEVGSKIKCVQISTGTNNTAVDKADASDAAYGVREGKDKRRGRREGRKR